jgi:16S rRNA processing protein RimM
MEKLAIGIILTSFGVHGELKIKSLSGETGHFFQLKEVYIKKGKDFLRFQVEGLWKKKENIVVIKLEGIDNPEEGKKYCGTELWVEREFACPVQEDEYYYGDLCACTVVQNEQEIGKVRSVYEAGSLYMLEVVDRRGGIVVIPFTSAIVGDVNIKENKIFLLKEAEID